MSSGDNRYPAGSSGRDSPPIATPNYGSSYPNGSNDDENARKTRCVTGVRFLTSLHGILNIITVIALVCVLIASGVVNMDATKQADNLGGYSKVKVSAYHTRNASLAFAVIGLILILIDTILHVTKLINRLPAIFDIVFIVIMLIMAAIFFILGCCTAAWEKKMSDTISNLSNYKGKGGAGASAFFYFVATIITATNFILRLISSKKPTAG